MQYAFANSRPASLEQGLSPGYEHDIDARSRKLPGKLATNA
jgi:hypothetical protein